jgi:hypothetical protein
MCADRCSLQIYLVATQVFTFEHWQRTLATICHIWDVVLHVAKLLCRQGVIVVDIALLLPIHAE